MSVPIRKPKYVSGDGAAARKADATTIKTPMILIMSKQNTTVPTQGRLEICGRLLIGPTELEELCCRSWCTHSCVLWHNVAMRLALVSLFCVCVWAADTMPPAAEQQLAREMYQQMIEVKSGFTTGTTTPIAESVAARFKAAGFASADIFVGGAIPTKANVVVRYRGTGARKPILLLAHIDVVEARREDWNVDPFVFLEKDGYFYGRGTADDKAQAAVWVATLLRFKREGFKPDRDLILALTADEEGGLRPSLPSTKVRAACW